MTSFKKKHLRSIFLLKFFLLTIVLFSGCEKNFILKCNVINAGVGGNNSSDLLKRLNSDVFVYSPDLVIIMVGTNDFYNQRKLISLTQYELNIKKLVHQINEHGSKVLLLSPPPVRALPGIDPIIVNAKIDSANVILKKISQADSCLYFDLNSVIKDELQKERGHFHFLAGIHPDANGYIFIGTTIYNYLKGKGVEYKAIVCFGDSITNGSGTSNKGTVTGNTYPGTLFKLLNR